MSDQISEKMARKLARQLAEYTCYEQSDQLDAESRCMRAWRSAGLIKPSKPTKLNEVRKWVRDVKPAAGAEYSLYYNGVRDTAELFEAAIAELFEAAIAEILEERE